MSSLFPATSFDPSQFMFAGQNAAAPVDLSGIMLPNQRTGLGAPVATAGAAQLPTGAGNFSLGMNPGTLQLGLSGLQSLGNLWSAFQARSMANKQLDLQRQAYDTNLTNSLQSYNTALTDKIGARAKAQGMTAAEEADYLAKNRLTR